MPKQPECCSAGVATVRHSIVMVFRSSLFIITIATLPSIESVVVGSAWGDVIGFKASA
ncbi:MAG: hypothetical protein ACOVP2_11545 [Armatimonadaceae bacterium]|jgi:hypothetical protein